MTTRKRPGRKTFKDEVRHDETELVDPAWERQRWETPPAYERFRAYRDLGATRTLARVAEVFGVAEDTVHRQSRKYVWVERANRWDAHLDTLGRGVTESATREAAALNAQRVAEMKEAEWRIWEAVQSGVLNLIEQAKGFTITDKATGQKTYVAGDPKAGGAAAQLIREGSRVARMATGQPTEGSRPKPDETGREADLDAFLDGLSGGHAPDDVPVEAVPPRTANDG